MHTPRTECCPHRPESGNLRTSTCTLSAIARACTSGQLTRPMGVLECESARKGGTWVGGGDADTMSCSDAAYSSSQQTTSKFVCSNLMLCEAGRDWAGARERCIRKIAPGHFPACSAIKPCKAAIRVMVGAHELIARWGGLPCQGRNCTPKCAASTPPGRNGALTCLRRAGSRDGDPLRSH